ncbi:hypothetical protein C8A05DRAFT_35836 [Staphylotrichum tortipilum]|uniref:ATPase synthesis protein 25 n=1 Tax=Staphylotrichum tortipilum TaxID=2831512 RepID=A0AAN6MGM7_9PEZI|nr:hypothetical protein C8A05DRAFT_35836 [Staphylotrichum longicolle]
MVPASAARTVRCSACSASASAALRLFALRNAADIRSPTWSPRTTLASPSSRRFPSPTAPSAAAFSTFRPTSRLLGSPAIEEHAEPERAADGEKTDDAAAAAGAAGSDSASDVPWYLQVEAPRHPTLVHEQAPLPPIPHNSPKLTEPLLKYIADELGLDSLSLLDLRNLDPPPALGPSLLMIFGTARSERHLHVSADRLVRWLRGRGVAASADGLLGRNELKTKLRRIARKAKLMGTSGVPPGGDDGITTGWVCVSLGMVGGSHEEILLYDDEGRPTGFGVPQTGTTMVVQLMTEARRAEMDLESLWGGMLKRSKKKAVEDKPSNRPSLTGFS